MTADMDALYKFTKMRPRWASFENPKGAPGQGGQENQGTKGHAFDSVAPGTTVTLLDVQGCGLIQRMWLTLRRRSLTDLRAFRLEMFWDGAAQPAVSVPLGDFFCAGLGLRPFQNALFASPEGQSFIATVPMPFRTAARITLTNDSAEWIPHLFYDINYALLDSHADDALYFHAHWRRENPTTLGQDFEILPRVQGNGRFLGSVISVITNPVYQGSWWGEGEVKVYLDGDTTHPTLVGTGTEDYIGTGWGQGTFVQQHQGSLVADSERGHYNFYRWHIPDPIFFSDTCRVTMQQIGGTNRVNIPQIAAQNAPMQIVSSDGGSRAQFHKLLDNPLPLDAINPADWCNFYRVDDWAAVAYFYLDRPSNDLPSLADVAARTANLAEAETVVATIAEPVRRDMYLAASLRLKPNGFAFNLQNQLGSSTLVGFKALWLDGRVIDLAQISLVSMHGVFRRARTVTSAQPLIFTASTTLRVQVEGERLTSGAHTLIIQIDLQEVPGIIEITATDYID